MNQEKGRCNDSYQGIRVIKNPELSSLMVTNPNPKSDKPKHHFKQSSLNFGQPTGMQPIPISATRIHRPHPRSRLTNPMAADAASFRSTPFEMSSEGPSVTGD
ncbi:hypothetical protein HPP92_009476 [Vanilla planifolia]|uniref:Uncharacterized protein n=1 Tax=Vanilla planifolia TaxID=51239 RepID=A0A835RG98_VANPL|nr:hypothetical protein HPP92_009476 [Vanilla planifolia]